MQSQFSSRALPLQRLFSDPFLFDSPVYQRPYAWTTDEAGRLLDDLLMAFSEEADKKVGPNNDYFIGAILLDDPLQSAAGAEGWPWSGALRPFHIIDGQQRLVTLTILFCVLRNLLAEEAPVMSRVLSTHIHDARVAMAGSRSRMSLRGAEDATLAELIIAPLSYGPAVREASGLSIEPMNDAQLRLLHVRDHFVAALEGFDPSALIAFAGFILESCTVVIIATRNIDRAHRMFTVLNNTGKDLARSDILKAELLGGIVPERADHYISMWDTMTADLGSDFEQLFSHVRAVQGRTSGPIIAATRQLITSAGSAADFIDGTVKPAADILLAIKSCRHTGTPQSAEISAFLRYWSWVQGQDWIPPLMAWWLRCKGDGPDLLSFMRELDSHVYGTRIMGLGADRRTQRLAPVLAAIRSGASLDELRRLLVFTKDDHRTLGKNLRDLYARSQSTCKLVLLRINAHWSEPPLDFDPAALTVEHVLPLKPSSSSLWRSWYPNADERAQCAACIGNMTLVSRQQNEKARNLDLEIKLPIYFPTGDSETLRILEDFRGRSIWSREDVREREALMLNCIGQLWNVGPAAKRQN
jgi:Protein of unknown function DUF262/Protein of unknown function (DUF1524)